MKITKKKLKNILEKTKKRNLQDILNKDYPNAKIYIIKGYDRFSNEKYIRDAFFDKNRAYSSMSKIPPNGSPEISDIYQIYSETPSSLKNNTWDDIDRLMIYDNLIKNYILESRTTKDIGQIIINMD